jgi:hypothetical protein
MAKGGSGLKTAVKFSWKDHLRGIWGTMFDPKLQVKMRIKHLNSLGYGDENPMVQVLKKFLVSTEKPEGSK